MTINATGTTPAHRPARGTATTTNAPAAPAAPTPSQATDGVAKLAIQQRAEVRRLVGDGALSAADAAELKLLGITDEQVRTLCAKLASGGKLSSSELMETVNTKRIAAAATPANGPAAPAATAPAAKAQAAAAPEASDGPAHRGRGTYKVISEDVYLRTHRMGLVRGVLKRGQEFVVLNEKDGWAWGAVKGTESYGWVPFGSGKPGEKGSGKQNLSFVNDTVPKGIDQEPRHMAKNILYVGVPDRREANDPKLGFFRHMRLVDPTARLHLNLDGNTPVDDSGVDLTTAKKIRLRYEAKPGVYMMNVIDQGGRSRWGFMEAKAVELIPGDSNNVAYDAWLARRNAGK